jgi:rubrerythrin
VDLITDEGDVSTMSEKSADEVDVEIGATVYDEDGEALGTVQGFDEEGFHVSTGDDVVSMSVEHLRAGHQYGEGEMMWRCYECGHFGDLQEGFPDECPDCGAPKEDLYYYKDD